MAMQMLYQHELGGSSLEQIFASFDLSEYLEESDSKPGAEDSSNTPPEALLGRAERSFDYARRLVEGTLGHCVAIDDLIREYAENWRLERMPPIDRNILRLAIYEMLHEASVPKVVIVDEAIELAKKFGTENSGRFVNGLLDGVLQSQGEAVSLPAESPDEGGLA